jgi:uncharacterized protein YbaR (Trm112 family)
MEIGPEFDPDIWKQWLVCPMCKSVLEWRADAVQCRGCGRVYPVEDGIPVLLRERATLASERSE